jgi:dTDP-4-amino-4,6-dideoxygalactose transaminase
MTIPFADLCAEIAHDRAAINEAIARVLDSGVFIGGTEVASFENELAAVCGVAHAIGTSSGTDALHVLGMATGIADGSEIVTTPFTFYATAGAFARLGARVVFADIDPLTLTLSPDAAQRACTNNTRAIVMVHLFGRPCEVPASSPCPVFDDAAQSIGGVVLTGAAATLSFFPTKNIGAVGDAGAVLTNDGDLAARVRVLRGQGAREKHRHVALGGNFRLDALQAAVLRVKLRRLADVTERRRSIARRYRAALAAASLPAELHVPPDDPRHVYHHFVIRAPRRDALREHLTSAGIATEVYYPVPLHLQPCFADLGYRRGSLPHAEAAADEVLALPMYPSLTSDAQDRVVDELTTFYRHGQ